MFKLQLSKSLLNNMFSIVSLRLAHNYQTRVELTDCYNTNVSITIVKSFEVPNTISLLNNTFSIVSP